jgi:L-asparaginase II
VTRPAELVRVIRNGLVESVHVGDVAVVDPAGRVVASAGATDRLLFGRSCEKPVQGAVSIDAIDEPGLTDDEVAVLCGSHDGDDVHLRAVRKLLRRGPVPASALRNPRDRRSGGSRSRLHDNCSGKHAAMLVASARNGWDLATYRERRHPIQRRVARAVAVATGVDDPIVGVDGCGLPVHGVPLRAMATMYARLARPEAFGRLAPAVERVVTGMLASPLLVGGRKRLDSDVIAATGDVVAKEGAEGLVCAALLGPGLGVAVKVADGSWRRSAPAFVKVLDDLGVLDRDARDRLAGHARLPVLGGDEPQGAVEAVVRLRRARR